MPDNARKLCLYLAIGLTALMIMFPPFVLSFAGIGGASFDEYGFLLSGPATARQALAAAAALAGPGATNMTSGMVPYSLDVARLLIQLAVVWSLYVALVRTVLKRPSPASVR